MPVQAGQERSYEMIMSNLYAAWALYESGFETRVEAARKVVGYLERKEKSGEKTGQKHEKCYFMSLSDFLCKWKILLERNPFFSKLNGKLV